MRARVLGYFAGLLLKLISWTLRGKTLGLEHRQKARMDGGPVLYAIWHEQQLQNVFFNDEKKMASLASRSSDGEIITKALAFFGIKMARGSSSRGGAAALHALTGFVKAGFNCAITVDGPRGPRRSVKPGIFALAKATGRPIIATACVVDRAWKFSSWDRFEMAKPFARGRLVFSEPLWVKDDAQLEIYKNLLMQRFAQAEICGYQSLGISPP